MSDADDKWMAQYDAWEATRDRMRAEFIEQVRTRFARDRIVSVESYGDEVRFTSSLTKATRPGVAYQVTDFEGDEPIGHHEYDDLDEALAGLWDLASPRTKGVPPVPNPRRNPSDRPPFKYRYCGTNDEASECGCCGRQDLKRVAWLVALDEDGNEIGEPVPYGTTCAGMLLRDVHHTKGTKKPTKGQSEKLFEENRKASLIEAWTRAIEQPLPPMPEISLGQNKYGVHVVQIGDEHFSRTTYYDREGNLVPSMYPDDDIARAKKKWLHERRLEFAVEIAQQMGLQDVHWSNFGSIRELRDQQENPARLRRTGARIANP